MIKKAVNRKWKWIKKLVLYLSILILLVIIISNVLVSSITGSKLYSTVDDLPYNKVGLVLGTSKYLVGGLENEFFKNRIEAAYLLFTSGKIDYILISGDNGTREYNEPKMMKEDLIKMGVPADRIFLDYAGFRTLDSVIRCKKVFQQDKITIISQKFHNERAVFIASFNDIEAVGFNAAEVTSHSSFKTKFRELFARVKLMLDIVLNKQPKFLGEQIEISSFDMFDWLIGEWKVQSGDNISYESWKKDNARYEGHAYHYSKNDTVIDETIVIEKRGEDIFYIPTVFDQNNEKGIDFKMISSDNTKLSFENSEHDFPNKINYFKINDDSIDVWIEGLINGEEAKVNFGFSRLN